MADEKKQQPLGATPFILVGIFILLMMTTNPFTNKYK
jgi:hypothetical protein